MSHPTHPEPSRQAAFLELFFDLVFVYAVTQVAAFIHHEPDGGGILRATLIFIIIWWGWSQFTWTCNGIDTSDRRVHVAVLVATVLAFFMAQGLTDAYSTDGEWFTVPFALSMAVGLGLYWWGLRDEPDHQRALVTYLPLAVAGAVAAGVSGFLPDSAQEWGYAATIVLFIAAGIASALGTPFHVYAKHFAERHGLIVIIALGESIIAVGIGSGGLERTAEFLFAAGSGIVMVGVFWWAYFNWFQESTEEALTETDPDNRAPMARDIYTFAHFAIVFGVVGIAVAVEEIIAHPDHALPGFARFTLGAGAAAFMAGIVAGHLRAHRTVLWARGAIIPASLVAVWALADADAIYVGLTVTGIVVAGLAVEAATGVARPKGSGE